MKRFEFKKTMVESSLPPKDTNMLWVDTNEASKNKEVLTIKEFIDGEWTIILAKPNAEPTLAAEPAPTNLLGE